MTDLLSSPGTPVIVTGAGSGIGRACARALAEVGRPVAVWDLDGEGAAATARSIQDDFGQTALARAVDVRATAELDGAVAEARRGLGPIGGLVHAAGVSGSCPIDELTEEAWDFVLDVNLRAFPLLVRALLGDLRATAGAAVVGIGSIASFLGYEHMVPYTASKSGMMGVTRSLALTLAGDGVRVNMVCPGNIDTPMLNARATATPERRAAFERHTPLGRLGRPEDIASAARFLLSDQASYVTGTYLLVDGGIIAQGGAPRVG
ncbi:MAG: SDR family NAD(P)-dependent oxidoreductase [Actinomycetota bacterium]|nr:SDR family NAD(P)-dependent oxidoreductase [Actinomycetota bacterium]